MTSTAGSHAGTTADLAEGRAGVYGALATLFLDPPSAELVSGLLDLSASADTAELFGGPGAACLRRYAAAYRGDIGPLQQEFHDLFRVPLGRYVMPYEAVYRDERVVGEARARGLLMGPSTLAVMAAYRESGLHVSSEAGELPDHVGIELSFMALLCGREQEAWQAADQEGARRIMRREQRFLEEHLLRWVPALSRRIAENAQTDFYRGVALLTEEFLLADAATLARAFHHLPRDQE